MKYNATFCNSIREATHEVNVGMPITVLSPSKTTTNIKNIYGTIKVSNLAQNIRYHMELVLT
jgi:hypothetical protein